MELVLLMMMVGGVASVGGEVGRVPGPLSPVPVIISAVVPGLVIGVVIPGILARIPLPGVVVRIAGGPDLASMPWPGVVVRVSGGPHPGQQRIPWSPVVILVTSVIMHRPAVHS